MPAKKKATAKVKEELQEHCPICDSTNFSISESEPHQRYCQTNTCNHVWLPMSMDELKIHHQQRKLGEMKDLAKECEHIHEMYKAGEHIEDPNVALTLIRENLQKMQSI